MGTRSLTIIYNEDNKRLVTMYRHYDGYPAGHGVDLTQFLNGMQLVNGLSRGQTGKLANGMGCLAAQIIGHFKGGPGGIYIVGSGNHNQDYTYHVYEKNIRIMEDGKKLFDGSWEDGYAYCKDCK